MKKTKKMDFLLFDGEGGGEGSAGTASAGENTPNKPQESQNLRNVKYGSQGDNQATSQVGSEGNNGEPQNTPSSEEDLEREFAELIGKDGKFHQIYGRTVSRAIQERFRNQNDYQGQVRGYEQAAAPLFQKYGLEAGDIEGLTAAIAGDNDIYQSRAEELGITVDQHKYNLQLERDAERGRKLEAEFMNQQRRNAMFSKWSEEAESLKQAFPRFDLSSEIRSNPRFLKMLDSGATVEEAFAATHMSDILSGLGQEASKQATANVVNNFKQQAARPVESGMKHTPSATRKVDPSEFSDADINEIERRIEEEGFVLRF